MRATAGWCGAGERHPDHPADERRVLPGWDCRGWERQRLPHGQRPQPGDRIAVGGAHGTPPVHANDQRLRPTATATATLSPTPPPSQPVPRTPALTASTSDRTYGQSVTFTASVSGLAPGAGIPTGSVTFLDGSTSLGTGTLDGTGTATLTTSSLIYGSHLITAGYGGDGTFTTSTAVAVGVFVHHASTTLTLTSSSPDATFGQSLTFTATVSTTTGGGTPTGSISFSDSLNGVTTSLGTGTLAAGSTPGTAIATFTTSSLAYGYQVISATYAGDSNTYASSYLYLGQMVHHAGTTLTLTSSSPDATYGQTLTFTATVSTTTGGGTPTGSITFSDSLNGVPSTLGTGTLTAGSTPGTAIATFSTSSLPFGYHVLGATYAGDTNTYASAYLYLGQVVHHAGTTLALTSSSPDAVYGQPLTFTATVSTTTGGGTPSGSITFSDSLNGVPSTLGTGTLTAGSTPGTAVATFSTSSLPYGYHTIGATYAGDTNTYTSAYLYLGQVVHHATTTTTLSGAPNPGTTGQSVTFTATVTAGAPGGGTPSGTVSFMEGSTTLGSGTLSGGVATFSTSDLASGSHTIRALYNGSSNFYMSISSGVGETIQ